MQNKNIFSDAARLRREAGEKSLQAFAELFFPHYLSKKSCAFHEELYTMLTEMTLKRGERVAIAAPRGSAKSAIVSLIFVLWCVCYKREEYVLLLSDTRDQAESFLSHIKNELEKNERLIESFPDICEIGQKPKPPRWTRGEILTRNGVKITALGAGQKTRGRRKNEIRPSLIILDDVENSENSQGEEPRQKLFDWFSKDILKVGSPISNVITIGTILHRDALLARLTKDDDMPGWTKKIYRSVISWASNADLWQKWAAIFNNRDSYKEKTGKEAAHSFYLDNKESMLEGTKVLWPEKEDYYALMVMREQESEWSFASEKQNDPATSGESIFNPDEMHYRSDNFRSTEELLQYIGNNVQFFGACDPAQGESTNKGDYTAIIVLARDNRDGTLYEIEADIKRRKPSETEEDILTYCKRYRFVKFGVEGNYFQDLMIKEMERMAKAERLYTIPFVSIKNTSNKKERIQSIQPSLKNGTIVLNKLHRTLIEQLIYFPKAKYDDGPDALQMAVALATKPQPELMLWSGDLPGHTSAPCGGTPLTLPADGSLVPYGWRPTY